MSPLDTVAESVPAPTNIKNLVEDTVLEEDDDDEEEDEEEEDDEEAEKTLQDFIVDEAPESEKEEEEDDDEEEEGGLDEDDLDLIAENMGIAVPSRLPDTSSKFKRLKKSFQPDDDEDQDGNSFLFRDDDEEEDNDRDSDARKLKSSDYDSVRFGNVPDQDREDEEEWGDYEDTDQAMYGMYPETVALISEVFGDVSTVMEILGRRRPKEETEEDIESVKATAAIASKKWVVGREPEEAEKEYLTDADDIIRQVNMPERHFLKYRTRLDHITSEEISKEASWIAWRVTTDLKLDCSSFDEQGLLKKYHATFGERVQYYDPKTTSVQADIQEKTTIFLHFLLQQKLEVPFILTHRGHLVSPPLNERLAWLIVDLDQEWSRLWNAASKTSKLLDQLQDDEDIIFLRNKILDFKTEEDIEDVRSYISLFYPNLSGADSSRRRRQPGAGAESLRLVQKFQLDRHWRPHLLTGQHFGTNITKSEAFSSLLLCQTAEVKPDLDLEHPPPPDPSLPGRGPEAVDAWLSSLTVGPFSSASRVLEAMLSLESRQLAVNVKVKDCLRKWFQSVARITTILTPKGRNLIVPGKSAWPALTMQRKPVDELLRAPVPELPPRPSGPGAYEKRRQQLEDRQRLAREATAFLEVVKAEASGLAVLVIHPLGPGEPAPWRDEEKIRPNIRKSDNDMQRYLQSDASDVAILDKILTTLTGLYVTSHNSTWAVTVQTKILQRMLYRELLPMFRRELQYKLQRRAEAVVAALCYDGLRWRLDQQPYRRADGKLFRDRDPDESADELSEDESDDSEEDDSDDDDDDDTACHLTPRVVGIVIERLSNGVRVHAVGVDRSGRPTQYRTYDRLLVDDKSRRQVTLSARDFESSRIGLRKFLLHSECEIVVIGASDILAKQLHNVITKLRDKLKLKRRFEVVFGSLEIPRIFASSDLVPKEYRKTYGVQGCQTISLAHSIQDPLASHLQLWSDHASSPNLLLNIKFHPLQEILSRERLETCLLQAAMSSVSNVGIDLNAIRGIPHLQSPLQFIPGLGPRKAADILTHLSGPLTSRQQLAGLSSNGADEHIDEDKRLNYNLSTTQRNDEPIGNIVLLNCASFIRIAKDIAFDVDSSDPLACTRVHPTESYVAAQKMARDALEDIDHVFSLNDCFIKVNKNPSYLEDLDLEEYSIILNSKHQPRMLPHMEMIRKELESPYKDPRLPFEEISGKRLFYSLVQEDPYEFLPGSETTAAIVESRGSTVRLLLQPSNLVASPIDLDSYLSQEANRYRKRHSGLHSANLNVESYLPLNSVVSCRIKSINYSTFIISVVLSDEAAASLLADVLKQDYPGLVSPTLSSTTMYQLIQLSGTRKSKFDNEHPTSPIMKQHQLLGQSIGFRRRISHPRFRLLTSSKAINELKSGRIGDALFTPSEHSLTELVLFIKTCHTPFMVKAIIVQEFNQRVPGELGRILKIEDEKFINLDQILGQYVEALRINLNEVYDFEKYRVAENLDIVESLLLAAQETKFAATGVSSIEWGITIDEKHPSQHPGIRFHLIAIPPQQHSKHIILKDGIYVTSQGFKLWTKKERSLRRLTNWWKAEGYFQRKQLLAEYHASKKKKQDKQQFSNGWDHKIENNNRLNPHSTRNVPDGQYGHTRRSMQHGSATQHSRSNNYR